jgi:hypothetical protein
VNKAAAVDLSAITALNLRLREFEFGDEDFEALRQLVKQVTGISPLQRHHDEPDGVLPRAASLRASQRARAEALGSTAAGGASFSHLVLGLLDG